MTERKINKSGIGGRELTVGELIEELKKYSPDARLGYWACNAHLRGDTMFIHRILGVEYCRDGKTVSLIGDFS